MPPALATIDARPADQESAGPEFAFERSDFEVVRRLIHREAGIHLQDGKQAMVYSRVARRLRETGHRSFREYLGWLESGAPAIEWQEFVNCLTTNLTSFFRESHHFDELAAEVRAHRERELLIWCSAASTGEEPYSIAMTVAEALPPGVQVRIVASDIDTRVLTTAAAAVYPADSRGLSPERLRRHCLRGTGPNAGRIRIRPEVASRVEFRTLNLIERDWNLGATFHIVFCRNVMIYFDAATQRRVLEGMHRVLRPGGRLYVGHSENFTDSRDLFRLRGRTIYDRVGST
jgi:chemotaxis protein methyltransferase CheR